MRVTDESHELIIDEVLRRDALECNPGRAPVANSGARRAMKTAKGGWTDLQPSHKKQDRMGTHLFQKVTSVKQARAVVAACSLSKESCISSSREVWHLSRLCLLPTAALLLAKTTRCPWWDKSVLDQKQLCEKTLCMD